MALLYVSRAVEFAFPNDRFLYRIPRGFQIEAGEKVCIAGQSGSGKSTILTLLAGLRRFATGEIVYHLGEREQRLGGDRWRAGPDLWRGIGFSFQRPELVNALSVEGNLRLSLGSAAEAIGRELFPVRRLATGEAFDEWSQIKHRRPILLSGGQKLRLGLGRGFGSGQSLIIVDEPTAALDKDNRKMVADFIKARSRSVGLLLVAHDTDFIDSLAVDRKFVIDQRQESIGGEEASVRELRAASA